MERVTQSTRNNNFQQSGGSFNKSQMSTALIGDSLQFGNQGLVSYFNDQLFFLQNAQQNSKNGIYQEILVLKNESFKRNSSKASLFHFGLDLVVLPKQSKAYWLCKRILTLPLQDQLLKTKVSYFHLSKLVYRNSKEEEATFYSEKILKPRIEYHVTIRSQFDSVTNMQQVGLFVNGFDDLKTACFIESSLMFLGKYKIHDTFTGSINNLSVFYYPATDKEIRNMKQQAQDYMNVFQKSVYIENTETYLKKKNVPIDQFISLGVNDEFFNANVDSEGNEAKNPQINPTEKLMKIFADPEHGQLRSKVALIIQPCKYEYLMKTCALISTEIFIYQSRLRIKASFNSIIEISRFMTTLKYLNSEITADELWFLASNSGCGQVEEEDAKEGGDEKIKTKNISFQALVRSMRKSIPYNI